MGDARMARKKAREIRIDEAWCKRCRICVALCPRKVLAEDEGGMPRAVDLHACTLCDLCVLRCPDFAIWVLEDKEAVSRDAATAPDAG